jgi:hypothetical protein
MKFTLSRLQIDDAIALGTASLGRFAGVKGRYNNTFNSHTLGRFGEIAVASLFQMSGYTISPHYRDAASLKLCDVEVLGPVPYPRLEVKTWGLANWLDLGRCIQVGQIAKITESADAIVWCTVPLPYLNSANDLSGYSTLDVEFVGFSLPSDITKAPIRLTGRPNRRQVENYQVSQSDLRNPLGLLPS